MHVIREWLLSSECTDRPGSVTVAFMCDCASWCDEQNAQLGLVHLHHQHRSLKLPAGAAWYAVSNSAVFQQRLTNSMPVLTNSNPFSRTIMIQM
jgi:hypothetical protein